VLTARADARQENAANTAAAEGLLEHLLGIANPAMLAAMPKVLQNLVVQASMHAVEGTDAQQARAGGVMAAGKGALSPAQLAALAGRMGGGGSLAKVLQSWGQAAAQSPAQMMAAQQLQLRAPYRGVLPQQGQQQLQAEQGAGAPPVEGDVAQAPVAAFPPQQVAPQAVAAEPVAQAPVATWPPPQQVAPLAVAQPVPAQAPMQPQPVQMQQPVAYAGAATPMGNTFSQVLYMGLSLSKYTKALTFENF
jgi:hypothetical protein